MTLNSRHLDRRYLGVFSVLLLSVGFVSLFAVILAQDAIAGTRAATKWDWRYERVRRATSYQVTGTVSAIPPSGGEPQNHNGATVYPSDQLGGYKDWHIIGGPVSDGTLVKWVEKEDLIGSSNWDNFNNGCKQDDPMMGMKVGGGCYIKNWNPVDQEYALGYIDFGTNPIPKKDKDNKVAISKLSGFVQYQGIWWYCSARTYPKGSTNATVTGSYTNSGASTEVCTFSGGMRDKKDLHSYVDQLSGAQYMDQLYDVRRYAWSGYGSNSFTISFRKISGRPYGPSTRNGDGQAIYEFHFYPAGTLAALDEQLVYRKNVAVEEPVYEKICTPFTDICYEIPNGTQTRVYDAYIRRDVNAALDNKKGEVPIKFTSENTYCDLNLIKDYDPTHPTDYYPSYSPMADYQGYDPKADNYDPHAAESKYYGKYLVCKEEDYEAYLRSQEDKIYIYESDGKGGTDITYGKFKGYIKVDDLDGTSNSGGAEGYTPLQGGYKVWLTGDSHLIRRAPVHSKNSTENAWWRIYCQDAPVDDLCHYEWSGTVNSDPDYTPAAYWLAFESTPDKPFTIAYQTMHHASSMTSENARIVYVIKGSIPSEIQTVMDEYRENYKLMYGEDYGDIDFVKNNSISPDEILITFNITRYGYYNPYTINKIIKSALDGSNRGDLLWYASKQDLLEDNYLSENTSVIVGETATSKSYGGNQSSSPGIIFYGSFGNTRYTNFDPTCASGNDESVRTDQIPKAIVDNTRQGEGR